MPMKTKIGLLLLVSLLIPSAWAIKASEVLYLDQLSDYPVGKDSKPTKFFLISNSMHENLIELNNRMGDIDAQLECDGNVSVGRKKPAKQIRFKLKDRKQINLSFSQDTNSCLLKFSKDSAIRLVKDEVAYPFLRSLNRSLESCRYQYDPSKAFSVEGMFLSNSYPMMTCAHAVHKVEILQASEDGLLSKMEALLGYKPSIDFIHNLNPYAELDFSKAPKLDAIFVSTLLYRHDFSGTVLARLLKFHAERGTLVNIIGTGYMHEEKDKALLKELSQVQGNLRIQEYKYIESRLLQKRKFLTNYLRDMHVKMFVTLSSENPDHNTLIMGGRNVHDGFVFSEKPDLSKYPELDQSPEGDYAYWNDLEIKVTSPELARSVYSHLLSLWNRKIKGQKVSDIQVSQETAKIVRGEEVLNSSKPMMRHVMSLPFNDDQVLEKLYVEMIDKAQTSIKLSSPYLRPTKAIMAAFERAIKRKVDVIIQTRIDLKGDTQAWLYEEANKAAINSLYDQIRIYEWTERSILHTKMLLIDGKFAFFGSVNLSRRSFIQDVENGFIIHDQNFVQKLTDVFDDYNARSRILDQKQKRKLWASIVMQLLQNQF